MSEEEGDGAGYEIGSLYPEWRNRLIEVKTTNGWERSGSGSARAPLFHDVLDAYTPAQGQSEISCRSDVGLGIESISLRPRAISGPTLPRACRYPGRKTRSEDRAAGAGRGETGQLLGCRPLRCNGQFAPDPHGRAHRESSRMWAAPFSPIMMAAALVLAVTMRGMIEASTTRSPSIPCTRRRVSTTASSPVPIRQVPTGCRSDNPARRQ